MPIRSLAVAGVTAGVVLAAAMAVATPRLVAGQGTTSTGRPRPTTSASASASTTPTADPGPAAWSHRGLPHLWPAATPATIRVGGSFHSGSTRVGLVRATPPGTAEEPRVDLVEDSPLGHTVSHVPDGWPPVAFTTPLDLGTPAVAVVTSQEGGDADTWRLWYPFSGSIVPLHTHGPVPLGGGFTSDGATAYLSWIGPDGHLYTRIGEPGTTPHHPAYDVWTWSLGDGASSGPPTLRAQHLGTVCLDDSSGVYGRC